MKQISLFPEAGSFVKPVWFDAWFDQNFPDSSEYYSPKEVAFAFGVSERAIYYRLKSCEIEHMRRGSGNSSIMIFRHSIYDFALSCYCLNT